MKSISNSYSLTNTDNWEPDVITNYGGSERKEGLIGPDQKQYLIKYAEAHTRVNGMDTSYVNNVLSEYIGSHVLQTLGFPVHNTFVGTRNGELIVGCENFSTPDERLVEFDGYMRKYYDSGQIQRIPDIEQIKFVLDHDPILRPKAKELYSEYWDRFIGDALIGNFDRHSNNWGYLVDTKTRSVRNAPIYDNGSTLYPALSESGMMQVIGSPKETARRILLFPKAALLINGQKVSYLDIMSSDYEPELSRSIRKTVPKIQQKLPDAINFINNIPFISETRKQFYTTMLNARMDFILEPAYETCIMRNYSKPSYDRIATGTAYTEKTFERFWKANQNIQRLQTANTKNSINNEPGFK